MSTPLQPLPAAPRLLRAEHVVMAAATLALVVLLLPLAFLGAGSVTADEGLTLARSASTAGRAACSARIRVKAR
jgi:hypothetical protein